MGVSPQNGIVGGALSLPLLLIRDKIPLEAWYAFAKATVAAGGILIRGEMGRPPRRERCKGDRKEERL